MIESVRVLHNKKMMEFFSAVKMIEISTQEVWGSIFGECNLRKDLAFVVISYEYIS